MQTFIPYSAASSTTRSTSAGVVWGPSTVWSMREASSWRSIPHSPRPPGKELPTLLADNCGRTLKYGRWNRRGMHRVSRRGLLATAGATAVAGLAGCTGVGGSSQPVTVGSLLPLSGPGALGDVAGHHERAVGAAVEHANRAGGVDGREVVHVSKDTEADPGVAAEAYGELAAEDSLLSIVGAVTSGVTGSLTERAAEDRTLLVSPSSTAPSLASAGRTDDGKFF